MPMPQQLPQITILRMRYPDPRKTAFEHEPQQQLRILAIGFLFAHSFRANLDGVADPRLKLQVAQQALEPARVSAGFHAHTHPYILWLKSLVRLLGFFAMNQASFAQFPGFHIHACDLLEARMIVTPYNQHVRARE
jgi:hypothetical protein